MSDRKELPTAKPQLAFSRQMQLSVREIFRFLTSNRLFQLKCRQFRSQPRKNFLNGSSDELGSEPICFWKLGYLIEMFVKILTYVTDWLENSVTTLRLLYQPQDNML